MNIKMNTNPYFYGMQSSRKVSSGWEKTQSKGNEDPLKTISRLKGDSITISSYGKNKNAIMPNKVNKALEGLMKQRENLLERKNDMMTDMLEKDKSPEMMREQLKEIDKQLKQLEEEIAKIQFEAQQKNRNLDEEIQKEKKNSTSNKDTPSSNGTEGLSSKTMSALISSNSDLKQIEDVSSMKTKFEGRSRILKKEIEIDEARSFDGKASENKYKEYDKLQKGISNLSAEIEKNPLH